METGTRWGSGKEQDMKTRTCDEINFTDVETLDVKIMHPCMHQRKYASLDTLEDTKK